MATRTPRLAQLRTPLRDMALALAAIGLVLLLTALGSGGLPVSTPAGPTGVPLFSEPLTAQSQASDVLLRMRHSSAAWQTVNMKAQIVNIAAPGHREEVDASLIVQQPNYFYLESAYAGQAPGLIAASDGTTLTRDDRDNNLVTRQPMPLFGLNIQPPTPGPPGYTVQAIMLHPLSRLITSPLVEFVFPQELSQWYQRNTSEVVGQEAVAGRDAVILRVTLDARGYERPAVLYLWVDAVTGLVLKRESYSPDGNEQTPPSQVVVTEIVYDAHVAGAVFRLRHTVTHERKVG